MKTHIALLVGIVFTTSLNVYAQYTVEKHRSGQYTYESVTNDPADVRKYTLANGLTVFTSVNKDEPRIQTLISVRAGSKNDPADATGLAHYLEHMLFKGTDTYGTLDFSKEKPLIQQIENLFEEYRKTTDPLKRAALYHRIDSVSGLAAKLAIPGEYDRMLKRMGARGTNAHTSNEETVYENDIPRNQLDRWLTVEAERFRAPVLRLFHTELEAVYEEKNRGLDNDGRRAFEALYAAVFPQHQYGTQTTIGTIDHLKNPSMKKIREYYAKYYVPNNMAIVLVGDIDPDQAVAMVDKHFAGLAPKPVEPFKVIKEVPLSAPVIREVFGPAAEGVQIAYRFDGAGSRDVLLMSMCDMLLSNNSAGLIDLNLTQKQKVLNAGCSPVILKDYSLHRFTASPRRGQKLEDAAQLLFDQIEELKKGNFTESTMKACINDLRIGHMKQLQESDSRASIISQAFIQDRPWSQFLSFIDDLEKLTKKEIVDFANQHYGNNYVTIYKRSGESKDVQKVTKPAITPVTVNRDDLSPFAKVIWDTKVDKIEPRFLDFEKDMQRTTLKNGAEVFCVKNNENQLYNLNFIWDYGTKIDRRFTIAMQYLDFLGAGSLSSEEIKTKLYELGCSIRVSASNDGMSLELSGLAKNLEAALAIVNDRFVSPVADSSQLRLLIDGILKQRVNMKKNKGVILQQAMMNYATYGKRNPFTNVLSESELRALTADEIVGLIKKLPTLKHKIEYYGPHDLSAIAAIVEKNHTMPTTLTELPHNEPFEFQDNPQGGVYFLDFDMVQAEVLMRMKGDVGYDVKNSPYIRLYNEYMGGLSGVVFQTIRESKALAYSVEAGFSTPRRKNDPYFMGAYIGTQADKLPEALVAMHDVLSNIPKNEEAFNNARLSILEKMEAERFNRIELIQQYDNLMRLGLDHEVRPEIYKNVPTISFDDLLRFRNEKVASKKFTLIVLGSKKKLNLDELKKYGDVKELSLEEVFGY